MQTEANLIFPFTLLCRELLGERSASRHLGDLWKSLLNCVQQRVGGPWRVPHSWPLASDYISASSLVYIFSLDSSHFPLCALWLLLYTSQILSWTVSPLRARAGSFSPVSPPTMGKNGRENGEYLLCFLPPWREKSLWKTGLYPLLLFQSGSSPG